LLAKYWEKLGGRLGDGPESLERVPEALARVTELLWRRALEEARKRLKLLHSPDQAVGAAEELQEQIGKLSVALAEARAREGEQLMHLHALSKEREGLRAERASLLALLKSTHALLQHSNARVDALQRFRKDSRPPQKRISLRNPGAGVPSRRSKPTRLIKTRKKKHRKPT
jgi:hypothetical protein